MVNRQDGSGQLWSPKKDSRVCSLHFVDGRPTQENPYPSLNLGYADTERKVKRLLFSDQVNLPPANRKRCLIMPSIEVPLSKPDLDPLGGDPSADQSRDATPDLPPCLPTVVSVHWTWFTAFLLLIQCLWRLACRYHDQARALHKQVQGLTLLLAEEKRKVIRLVAQVEKMKADSKDTLFASQILKTDDDVKFYTGIESKKLFNEWLEFVAPYIQRRWHGTISLLKSVRHFAGRRGPKPRLRTCDEFLMTLMRLRQRLSSTISGFCTTFCSRIFFSWIRGMATVLWTLEYMPDIGEIRVSKPNRFRHLPDIHSIIDCTEVFIETPKDLYLQAATWSDYNHHNTLKILVAVALNSTIVFASKAYCGRAGDKAVTLNSGYLDQVPPYSMLMADKGFNIANECADSCLSIHVPPGRRGQSQMTCASVWKTKRIANLRILVEQVIRQIKTFRLLKTELLITLVPHIDDIVTVCCALVNFKKSVYMS